MRLFYRTGARTLLLAGAGWLSGQLALADASYQETTQISGGSMLKMIKMASIFSSKARGADKPVASTVMVHGNKMVHVSPTSTEIIDLDGQTITQIDHEKRQYTVMTFAQIQEAMQRASEKAKEAKQQKGSNSGTNAQVSFNAKISGSGAVQQIDGRDATEALLTLTMDAQTTDGSNAKGALAITNEMWMIADAPGYEEVRQFNERMARLLVANVDASAMTGLLNTQPGANQALANLKKEAGKMKGIPVLQTMRMGITANGQPLPPPSASPSPNREGGNADSSAETSSDAGDKLSGLGKMMGGSKFGSLMRHKKTQDTAEDSQPAQSNGSPASATLLETLIHRTNFSAAPVDASQFEVPAGYKLLAPRKTE